MHGTYQTQTSEKSRPDRLANQRVAEIGDSSPAPRERPRIPFIQDKRVTNLLYRLQQDEEERLEEIRQDSSPCIEHDHDREPIRQINLTSSMSHIASATNNCSCLTPMYGGMNEQTLEHGEDGLSDAEIATLLKNIQKIDESLVDIPNADTGSLYSGLNHLLLNKKSIYNKQREQRVAHHLSEIRCHAEKLLMISPQRDLLLSLLGTDSSSSSLPSPISETT